MRRISVATLLLGATVNAYAVHGAKLTLWDVLGLLMMLFGGALPLFLVALVVVPLMLMFRKKTKQTDSDSEAKPPMTEREALERERDRLLDNLRRPR